MPIHAGTHQHNSINMAQMQLPSVTRHYHWVANGPEHAPTLWPAPPKSGRVCHHHASHQHLQLRKGQAVATTWQPVALAGGARRIACRAAAGSPPPAPDEVYPLEKTKVLVETAMLAAVGGLAYLLSSILKLETTLGYFLPLPVVLAAMRGGAVAGWKTMMSTAFLLIVLLGPLKAVSYILMHGTLAATLGTLWKLQANFWLCTLVGSLVRMAGMLAYLVLSSVTMNENLFAIMLSNVYAMMDQAVWALMGAQGSPPTFAIISLLAAMVLVSSSCYVFLLQVIYRIILQSMGYYLGPLPGIIRKYLYAGMPDPDVATQKYG